MSVCINDEAVHSSGIHSFSSVDHIDTECCDDRYPTKDAYTCARRLTSVIAYGEHVFALFQPEKTLSFGAGSMFLCSIAENAIDDKIGRSDRFTFTVLFLLIIN